jgi:DNA-binding beta-propeller fold protein YncE
MPTVARRVLPTVVAVLLLFALTLPPAGAVPSPTAAAGTLQFYGGEVRAIAQLGNTIYVGGSFTAVGNGAPSVNRANLVAVDATTGQLVTGFDPHPDNAVNALLVSADGSHLYAGGVFNNVRGCSQCDRLAMLDPATGAAVTTFQPRPNAAVLKLAQAGSSLFVGGTFATVGLRRRVRLAAVNATTGAVGGMALHADGAVRDLAVNPAGTTLYLAGAFTHLGGAVRFNFASIDIASRTLTAWNPNVHASGWGVALSPNGATAYLTTADGNESICNAGHESVIAMPATGSGTPAVLWHNGGAPGCAYNSGDVNAVEATASAVYVGGHLTNLCTVRNTSYTTACPGALTVRNHVAALDPATGVPLAWNPGATGTRGVLAIQALAAGLGVGGDFQRTNGVLHSGFALFPGTA